MRPDVYLIRHGETEWSRSGRHTGTTDLPLTEFGAAQARALAARLRGIEFSEVLSSPLQRARNTCELAGYGAAMQIDPDLHEWRYGDYEGLTPAQIHAQQPGWDVFRNGCPGGESPEALLQRVDRLVARLCAGHGAIAVFSHGHLLRALATRWLDLPLARGRSLLLGPASLSRLGSENDDAQTPSMALWNESSAIGPAPR